MKLLLLIPNVVLLGISGYNFFNDITGPAEPNYLVFKILHLIVMAICITFITIITRSMFTIKYTVVEDAAADGSEIYSDIELQHS